MSYIICPACHGEGFREQRATVAGPSPYDEIVPCGLCKGGKEVSERQADKWQQERAARAEGRWPR